MTPDRWQRVNTVFHRAVALPPDSRRAFLRESCGDDAELMREVESLLEYEARDSDFLNHATALAPPAAAAHARLAEAVEGQVIGPWRLVRPIGRGGMGAVWLAQRADGEFQMQAALKLIRRGFDSAENLRRFQLERQVLAGLEHPSIARMLDGGTTEDGQPWLAMEHVEGEPIDQYCDRRRLPIRERVELIRRVCAAVHHAHRRLIVHRDLKPGNILITPDGSPKLLDFGIAKILTPDGDAPMATLTEAGLRPMTPEYASPEQVRGEPVGTASDVYSLGVVLYELLVGERPVRLLGTSPAQIVDAVCSQQPARPSTAALRASADDSAVRPLDPEARVVARQTDRRRLARALSGDLDTIVLMALRKEPERRYGSAEALAEDLRRYLVGLPVSARPETAGYRLSKFVRRHRLGVAASVAAVAALLSLLGALVWQNRIVIDERNTAQVAEARSNRLRAAAELAEGRARTEAKRAATEAAKARQVAGFLQQMLGMIDPRISQDRDTTLLHEMFESADELADRVLQDQPEVLGEIRYTLGAGYKAIADYRSAERNLRESLRLREAALGPDSIEVMESVNDLGGTLQAMGRFDEAAEMFERALAIARRQEKPDHTAIASLTNNIGLLAMERGRPDEAEARFREAIAEHGRAGPAGEVERITPLANLALVLKQLGRLDDAEPVYLDVIEKGRAAFGPGSPQVAIYISNYAVLLCEKRDLDAGIERYREALEIQRKAFKEPHPDLAVTLDNLGYALLTAGSAEEAEPLIREAVEMFDTIHHGADHFDSAVALSNLAQVRWKRGSLDDARATMSRAESMLNRLDPSHPAGLGIHRARGLMEQDSGNFEAAESAFRRVYDLLVSRFGVESPKVNRARTLLIDLYKKWGRIDAAAAMQLELERVQAAGSGSESR
ncbi:MAG: hypothetical protein AMXMBFR47_43160 [Planctomycetota bacterium]